MKKFFVASHISEVYAPTYPLLEFIKKDYGEPLTVLHPFKGNSLYFVKDFLQTLFRALKMRREYDLYIGVSSLDVLPGILVKLFDRSKTIIYYSADYSRRRFGNFVLDKLYIGLDKFCSQRADFCWSVSERIRDIKRKNGVPDDRNLLVPNGAHPKRVRPASRVRPLKDLNDKISNSLFYVGHLTREKGVQDVLTVLKILDAYQLFIIGDGPYRHELEDQAASLKISDRVHFLGKMSNEGVLETIGKFEVGLAPYIDSEDYVYYCDPVKIKEYLAAGCPVVVSRAVWIAEEIERRNCGIAVKNFSRELPAAVKKISQNYQKMSKNALKFAGQFNWEAIYSQAFAKMNL